MRMPIKIKSCYRNMFVNLKTKYGVEFAYREVHNAIKESEQVFGEFEL